MAIVNLLKCMRGFKMKYNIKKNTNIRLILILFYISAYCIVCLIGVDVFEVNLLVGIFWSITSVIIIYKIIKNLNFYVFLYGDHICIKNKSKKLVIKLSDITKIDVWIICKVKYIVINYKDDNQIQLDYLKSFYEDIKRRVEKNQPNNRINSFN
jgi:hypothetical protein